MYFITGKLTENGKETAYSVYDTDKQRSIITGKKPIRQLVENGVNVYGFERFFNGTCGKFSVRKNREFLWKQIPELSGIGVPENPEDSDLQVLIGSNGFKEVKHYVTVNSIGIVKVYSKAEVKKEVASGNVIGMILDGDRIIPLVTEEITDEWLKSLGYERNDSKQWRRREGNG